MKIVIMLVIIAIVVIAFSVRKTTEKPQTGGGSAPKDDGLRNEDKHQTI